MGRAGIGYRLNLYMGVCLNPPQRRVYYHRMGKDGVCGLHGGTVGAARDHSWT